MPVQWCYSPFHITHTLSLCVEGIRIVWTSHWRFLSRTISSDSFIKDFNGWEQTSVLPLEWDVLKFYPIRNDKIFIMIVCDCVNALLIIHCILILEQSLRKYSLSGLFDDDVCFEQGHVPSSEISNWKLSCWTFVNNDVMVVVWNFRCNVFLTKFSILNYLTRFFC